MRNYKLAVIMLIFALILPLAAPVLASTTSDPLQHFMWFNAAKNEVHILVVNPTDKIVNLEFPSGKEFDVEIRQNEKTIWRQSDNKVFTPAVRTHEIRKGVTRFHFIDLPRLPRGNYTAEIYYYGVSQKPVTTTSFTVR